MISIPMSQTPQSYVIFYIELQKLLPFPLYLYIQTYLRYQPEKKSGIPESCTKKDGYQTLLTAVDVQEEMSKE